MKKTIIAFFALVSVAAASTTDADYITSNTHSTNAGGLLYNGFAITLNGNSNFANTSELTDTIADNAYVWLDYVEQKNLRDYRNAGTEGITLALVDSGGTVKALSTNAATSTGSFVWTFSNVQVSTTEILYFVYTATANTKIAEGYTLQSSSTGDWKNGTDMLCVGSTMNANYDTSRITGNGLLGNNYNSNMNLNTQFMPLISIGTSKVPEPTTATLSLLALAGLAARRRRR